MVFSISMEHFYGMSLSESFLLGSVGHSSCLPFVWKSCRMAFQDAQQLSASLRSRPGLGASLWWPRESVADGLGDMG